MKRRTSRDSKDVLEGISFLHSDISRKTISQKLLSIYATPATATSSSESSLFHAHGSAVRSAQSILSYVSTPRTECTPQPTSCSSISETSYIDTSGTTQTPTSKHRRNGLPFIFFLIYFIAFANYNLFFHFIFLPKDLFRTSQLPLYLLYSERRLAHFL